MKGKDPMTKFLVSVVLVILAVLIYFEFPVVTMAAAALALGAAWSVIQAISQVVSDLGMMLGVPVELSLSIFWFAVMFSGTAKLVKWYEAYKLTTYKPQPLFNTDPVELFDATREYRRYHEHSMNK